MTHVRTKRKPTPKNLGRMIFALILVFIFMGVIISIGNTLKTKNLNFSSFANTNFVNIKNQNNSNEPTWILRGDGLLFTNNQDQIFVEIASTTEARDMGLSGKPKLKVYETDRKVITEGMLFVFDTPQTTRFWMKDMNFDLDMIWLDENFKIVEIKNALASSYNSADPNSAEIFTNGDKLAKYVLEVNMGLVQKLNLKVGDTLKMQ